MKKKIILSILAIFAFAILGIWFFVFFKPTHFKRDVADEKGIAVSSKDIVKEFQSNEAASNTKYINKAVEITGEIAEVKKDQTGKTTIIIKSDDAFSNVFVTLKQTDQQPKTGANICIKGICTGFLSDVVVIDAIVTK